MLEPKHKLSNIDKTNLTADCDKCGTVSVYCHVTSDRTRYRCQVARKELKQRYPGKVSSRVTNLKELVIKQNGLCAICGREKKLVLDHDHSSGDIREALCHHCNTGIGHFFESADYLLAAVQYLRTHKEAPSGIPY
jgi:hypothetical protein